MLDGKPALLDACQHRKMKVAQTAANLLETRLEAEGILDGMDVRVDMHCIAGMPGESQGEVTIKGNLGQILAVLARVWPAAPQADSAPTTRQTRRARKERPAHTDCKD